VAAVVLLFGGGRLGGGLGGGGAIFLLLLAQSIGTESGLLLLLAEVELLVGVRRGLESGSEGGGLGGVGLSGGLLDLGGSLVDTLQLGLHEFAGTLGAGESELVHVEILLDQAVLDEESLLLSLHDPSIKSAALLDQILFFVTLDVERRDEFRDGLILRSVLLGLLAGQILLGLLQDEHLEHALLLLGELELTHVCWSRGRATEEELSQIVLRQST